VAAAADRGGVPRTLLEQVRAQAVRLELALVASQHGVAPDEVRDLRPMRRASTSRLGCRTLRAARYSVRFQAAHLIVGRVDVRDARILHLPCEPGGHRLGARERAAAQGRGRASARLLAAEVAPDEYDINLGLPRHGFLRQQVVQWRALAKYLPQTDLFHFYFGKTLVPKSLNMPILKARGRSP
jgi:hypothetical protein